MIFLHLMEVTCSTPPIIRYVGSHSILHTIPYDILSVNLLPLFVENIQVGVILQIKGDFNKIVASLGIKNV